MAGSRGQNGKRVIARLKTLKHSLRQSLSKQFPIWNKGLKSPGSNFSVLSVLISRLRQDTQSVDAEVFEAPHRIKDHKINMFLGQTSIPCKH